MINQHIIIVGAGICGLICARTLIKQGINVTIIEADKQSGGIIKETTLNNIPVELGPSCFLTPHHSSASNHILLEMLTQSHIPYRILELSAQSLDLFSMSGKQMNNITLAEHFLLAEQAMHVAFEEAKNFSENISLKEALGYLDGSIGHINHSTERTLINLWLNHIYGLSIEKTPAICEENKRLFHVERHALLIPESPLSQVIDNLIEQICQSAKANNCNFNLITNQQVTHIDYTNGHEIKIETSSATHISNHVVVTVPLSILKANSIHFTPALPKSKRQAIANISAATVEKIILPYRCELPSNKELIAIETKNLDRPMLFYNLKNQLPSAPNILMRILSHKNNDHSKEKNNQKLILDSHRAIAKCLGLKKSDLLINDAFVYNPQKTPHLAGSFSSHSILGGSQNARTLRQSIQGLHFSGEATHPEKYGTIQGAIESGYHSAINIMNKIKRTHLKNHKKRSA